MTSQVAVLGTDTVTIRTDAIHHLLAAAWTATSAEPEPDWLRAVASMLTEKDLPALPDLDCCHQSLVAGLAAARAAHAQARTEADAARRAHYEFQADVRRRAAQAVNEDRICLEGTNDALEELDIAQLSRRYRVRLLVPVTVDATGVDEDEAFERAEDELRDAGDLTEFTVDADEARREYAEPVSGRIDPDA